MKREPVIHEDMVQLFGGGGVETVEETSAGGSEEQTGHQ